jgi:hypothetical protein
MKSPRHPDLEGGVFVFSPWRTFLSSQQGLRDCADIFHAINLFRTHSCIFRKSGHREGKSSI